ncbi:MAG: hypothetical protein K0V04_19930 [Deltaproteobacteria bacterium]|nr:hypothetical protein [Deltaproteobacteria bacterium]
MNTTNRMVGAATARLRRSSVAALQSVVLTGLALSPVACQSQASDFDDLGISRANEADFEQIQVTLEDIANLDDDQVLVLDLDAEALFEVKAEVWTESSDRIMVIGDGAEMTVTQWVEDAQEVSGEIDAEQSLWFSGDAARFGLGEAALAALEDEGTVAFEIFRVLCKPCGYIMEVPTLE